MSVPPIIERCPRRRILQFIEQLLRSSAVMPIALACAQSSVALAQSEPYAPVPIRVIKDENGVDLSNGGVEIPFGHLDFGPNAPTHLMHDRSIRYQGLWSHNYDAYLSACCTNTLASVHLNGSGANFSYINDQWVDNNKSGGLMEYVGGKYYYTNSSGVKYKFDPSASPSYPPNSVVKYLLTNIKYPDGESIDIGYTINGYNYYILYAKSSLGYLINYSYDASGQISTVKAVNLAYDYCPDGSTSCTTPNQNEKKVSYSTTSINPWIKAFNFTDIDGVTQTVTQNNDVSTSESNTFTLSKRGSSDPLVKYIYGSSQPVASVQKGSDVWNYSWTYYPDDYTPDYRSDRTDPLGNHRIVDMNVSVPVPFSVQDGNGAKKNYWTDDYGRITAVINPGGNFSYDSSGNPVLSDALQYTYDDRGNLTSVNMLPAGGGTPLSTWLAAYPASCSAPVVCNKPLWTRDALGNQTDYTYDSVHGGVTSITRPAPAAGSSRPQQRFTYAAYQAYFKNSAGAVVASGVPQYKLTETSECATGSSCAGSAQEQRTSIAYGAQAPGTANNLLPVSITKSVGDGSLSSTSSMAYNSEGDLTSTDGPLAGADDTVKFQYDIFHRPVVAVYPDPDGAVGPRLNRAEQTEYNTNGLIVTKKVGTSDSAGNGFVEAYRSSFTYDDYERPVDQRVSSGATTLSVIQTKYRPDGKVDCSAQRMNPAAYGSLPASACDLGTSGSFGPDRIVKNQYDLAGQITSITSGYGLPVASTEAYTYAVTGEVTSIADGKGNKTAYAYDGYHRPVKTSYPSPTTVGSVSTTDYEQLTYDANSNVTQRRLRDGNTITFTYDNLGRVSSRAPNSENAVNYSYNLLGQVTQMQRPAESLTQTYSYDGLGRMTGEVQPFGAVTYQYDAAGRRTRLTWGDGLYASYDYDVTGNVMAIRENGAASGVGVLASYSYDNLGRRTGVTYGNGTSRTYAVDALGRLSGLKIDLAGTTYDHIIGAVGGTGAAIGYNPASQIASIARSNDAYAWTGAVNANRNYTTNGLNQYSAAGSVSFGYDGRGNLTSSGASTYTYDRLNELKSGPSATMTYDPAGRLIQYDASGSTRFYHDGGMIVAEVANPSGAILRRYVPGPGTDEPIVWYEGSGTSDRRFLQADERGSIVAVSDSAGNRLATNTYDEYGIPGSGNIGRFQYTGQAWFSEVGLAYYKARWYSPTLGRFMQTDPIGYGDGLNWYNYAHSDPVNGTDPTGLQELQGWDGGCSNVATCGTVTTDAHGRIVITGPHSGSGWIWQALFGLHDLDQWDFDTRFNAAEMAEMKKLPPVPNQLQSGRGTNDLCGKSKIGAAASFGGTVFIGDRGYSFSMSLGTTSLSLGRGTQFFFSGSWTAYSGVGAYAAAGPGGTVTFYSPSGALQSGASPSVSTVYGAGGAYGGGVEGSYTPGQSTSATGSVKGGYGAFVGKGQQGTLTLATPQLGCP